MYRGKNPSAIRSQEAITQSCLALMSQMPFEQITVKDIMRNSDLARQTFYQLFDTKDEILEYYLDGLFAVHMEALNTVEITNLCDAAKVFFRFFVDRRAFIALLIQNNRAGLLQDRCREYLLHDFWIHFSHEGIRNDKEKEYTISFVTMGMIGMLSMWIETGCTEDAEELALLVCRITNAEEESVLP